MTTPEQPAPSSAAQTGNADANLLLTDLDVYLFNEGSNSELYRKLGAHPATVHGEDGFSFAVWAPNAQYVAVIGDFNGWDKGAHPMQPRGSSGIWEAFIPGIGPGTAYKYHIASRHRGYTVDKADPFAFTAQVSPETASMTTTLDYEWQDGDWMAQRGTRNAHDSPISIYETHLGSWRRVPEGGNRSLSYRELAFVLPDYLKRLGFTHVEFLPVMEHPFFGSWGYQTTGYFAPTSRFGSPQDFMFLIDTLHQAGIGVILDWVPSHFPRDEHGLGYFDGTHLFEHEDPRQGLHKDWDSLIFNYGRREVQSFLMSSALFWLDCYHIDGIRVDAVASMLYLDYSREPGEWVPNRHGGRENLEAMDFLRRLNTVIYERYPDVQTYAEESTAWPMVSRPVYAGGLGFGFKWDMGWMHDTLQYMQREPVYRRYHHGELTFRGVYAWSENYVLSLSHDEVVYGKGSMLGKMPGDDWQQFANLRLLYAWQYAQPGKKLLFMGSEFAQRPEWNHDGQLDWPVSELPSHGGVAQALRALNALYEQEPALHALDTDPDGFQWLDANDSDQSTISFLRHGRGEREVIVVAFNFTPVPRENHRIGVPFPGYWQEVFNSDATDYWGSGMGNLGGVESVPLPLQGHYHSLTVTLPPLGAVFFKAPVE